MSQSVNWEDFDNLLVIKRLRELVGKWWKVQMHFTDEKGLLRGVPSGKFFNPLNPISKIIAANEIGFASCMSTVKRLAVEAAVSTEPKMGRSDYGISTLLVPIKVRNRHLGGVFADGFLMEDTRVEQVVQIKNFLQRMIGKDSDKLAEQIAEIPVLTAKEIGYLQELIQMVVQEIIMTQASLSDEKKLVEKLRGELGTRFGFANMIGKSGEMQKLYRMLERVADSDATILIRGENGTGKELIAKACHYNSKRKKFPFQVINCGAVHENLLESELFGHTKGSFTGAIKDKKGLFDAADGGTLFLDEIGDTTPAMQVKLLRVLQDGTFTPVGSTEIRTANVRVVTATNRNLEQMVKDGIFREDLYYRLNVIRLDVPALRQRKEDIPLLVDFFLKRNSEESKTALKKIAKECLQSLLNHDWPGNVRELENEIERLCVLAGPDTEIDATFLSQRILQGSNTKIASNLVSESGDLKGSLEDLERDLILDGLKKHRWNKSQLARELGISRAGLINKVKKYGLDKRTI